MRKTKIICTMGPATESMEVLEALADAGMNVARFNFSHGDHAEQERRMNALKTVREKKGLPIAILLDTKGPEIRVKDFKEGHVELKRGQQFTLTTSDILGDEKSVAITCDELYKDVSVGTIVLLDDGLISMQVVAIEGTDIICEVHNDGVVSNHKGINIPGVHLSLPYMSEKDRDDILFGIDMDVDLIAASFVRTKEDVLEIRRLLEANGGRGISIISKIENDEGVKNIDEIIEVSDGIMIARGDMGVEIPMEEVPVIQKMIIKKVYAAGKQVITATQMLDSMMKNPRPTRAEVTDVANAVYDGTSAIMLSGETAAGAYPVESLETMVRIAERTERDIDYRKRFFTLERGANPDITDAICHATCTTALDLGARAILTVTKSGYAARMISRYRPQSDIIACTMSGRVARQLNLSWGIQPIVIEERNHVLDLFNHAVECSKKHGCVKAGDTVVITSGVPLGCSGTTNMIKVATVS
ncbi:MAG: pyruvate kinase [bacterium]|nr:pyruvate kinase [bacterium]